MASSLPMNWTWMRLKQLYQRKTAKRSLWKAYGSQSCLINLSEWQCQHQTERQRPFCGTLKYMWMTENKGLTDRVHWPTEVFTWTKVSHQSSVSINFHSHYSGWCSYSFQLRWCAKFFAFYVGKWWSAC